MKFLLLCMAMVLSLLIPLQANSADFHKEKDYKKIWCSWANGQIDFELEKAVLIDCLTREYAVDFEFAENWAKAIGQARYYANRTGREPGIVLIMEDEDRDNNFLARLLIALGDDQRKWWVWVMDPTYLPKKP